MNWRASKRLFLPPCGPLVVAAAGAVMLFSRWAAVGSWLVLVGVGLLWLLATPAFGFLLLRRLERYPPLELTRIPADAAIVVLDAGRTLGAREWSRDDFAAPNAQTLERLRYGAELHRRTRLPILVTGDGAGELMALCLERDFGVKARFVEARSRHTQENADFSAVLLRAAGISRVVLVSHFWHLPRAAAAFRRCQLEVWPAPMGFAGRQRADRAFFSFLPSSAGLTASYWALHELVGLFFYHLRYLVKSR